MLPSIKGASVNFESLRQSSEYVNKDSERVTGLLAGEESKENDFVDDKGRKAKEMSALISKKAIESSERGHLPRM